MIKLSLFFQYTCSACNVCSLCINKFLNIFGVIVSLFKTQEILNILNINNLSFFLPFLPHLAFDLNITPSAFFLAIVSNSFFVFCISVRITHSFLEFVVFEVGLFLFPSALLVILSM